MLFPELSAAHEDIYCRPRWRWWHYTRDTLNTVTKQWQMSPAVAWHGTGVTQPGHGHTLAVVPSAGCRWSAWAAHGNGDTAATGLYVPPPRKYLLSLLYLGGPSFLPRFEYSLCSSVTITGSVRGSFQVSRMDNKGKIRWDNGIINVISAKKENRDEASIFKRHRSLLFNPDYVTELKFETG